jgi:hypothetical protein
MAAMAETSDWGDVDGGSGEPYRAEFGAYEAWSDGPSWPSHLTPPPDPFALPDEYSATNPPPGQFKSLFEMPNKLGFVLELELGELLSMDPDEFAYTYAPPTNDAYHTKECVLAVVHTRARPPARAHAHAHTCARTRFGSKNINTL